MLDKLPAPLFNWMGEMPWTAINSLFDPFFPKGLQWYWKGDFVKALPDEAIDVHIANALKAPTAFCLMHLYPIDGAVSAGRQGRDAVERARRVVLDGDRRHQPRSEGRRGAQALGPGLLEGRPPVQHGGRLRQLQKA